MKIPQVKGHIDKQNTKTNTLISTKNAEQPNVINKEIKIFTENTTPNNW